MIKLFTTSFCQTPSSISSDPSTHSHTQNVLVIGIYFVVVAAAKHKDSTDKVKCGAQDRENKREGLCIQPLP